MFVRSFVRSFVRYHSAPFVRSNHSSTVPSIHESNQRLPLILSFLFVCLFLSLSTSLLIFCVTNQRMNVCLQGAGERADREAQGLRAGAVSLGATRPAATAGPSLPRGAHPRLPPAIPRTRLRAHLKDSFYERTPSIRGLLLREDPRRKRTRLRQGASEDYSPSILLNEAAAPDTGRKQFYERNGGYKAIERKTK